MGGGRDEQATVVSSHLVIQVGAATIVVRPGYDDALVEDVF